MSPLPMWPSGPEQDNPACPPRAPEVQGASSLGQWGGGCQAETGLVGQPSAPPVLVEVREEVEEWA